MKARLRLAPLLLYALTASYAVAGVTAVPDTVGTPQVNTSAGGVVNSAPTLNALSAPALSLSGPGLAAPAWLPAPAPVPAAGMAPTAAKAVNQPPNIVFDVRGSRGGHGDVAAAYLTAYDILDRTVDNPGAVTPKITFVAGETERGILTRLVGRKVRDGDDLFDGLAKVFEPTTLPENHPTADVLMNLASSEGEFSRHSDLRWANWAGATGGNIPVNQRTVILTQTVFGNTESATKGPATALVGGRRLELSHAGLARHDAGIYADPVARELRGRSRADVTRYVKAQLEKTEIGGTAAVHAIIDGEVLQGAQVGLAYGISMKEVKPQFERYLIGLANKAWDEKSSYAIVTPSAFKLEDVKSPELRARMVVYDGDRVMPEKAERGKIYVIKTGTLPHQLFVGLMALSRPPPVLAGDGAMSAAVGLGRPFVMTKVGWNDANIKIFADRLSVRASPGKAELIKAVYVDSKLERASELDGLFTAYAETARAIPNLTDTMFAAVEVARDAESTAKTTDEILGGVKDPVLRASVISLRSLLGDADAIEMAFDSLSSDPRSRRLLASAMFRDMARRSVFLKPFRSVDFHPLNLLAAKIALNFTYFSRRSSRS